MQFKAGSSLFAVEVPPHLRSGQSFEVEVPGGSAATARGKQQLSEAAGPEMRQVCVGSLRLRVSSEPRQGQQLLPDQADSLFLSRSRYLSHLTCTAGSLSCSQRTVNTLVQRCQTGIGAGTG